MDTHAAVAVLADILLEFFRSDDSRECSAQLQLWRLAHQRIAQKVITEGGSVCPLDIGTGIYGLLANELTKTGQTCGRKVFVTTVDNNPNSLCRDSEHLIQPLSADAREPLDFADSTFDGLSASFVLEYFTERELFRAFREFGRVLAPGSTASVAIYGDERVNDLPADFDLFGTNCGWELQPSGRVRDAMLQAGFVDCEVEYVRPAGDFPGWDDWLVAGVVTAKRAG